MTAFHPHVYGSIQLFDILGRSSENMEIKILQKQWKRSTIYIMSVLYVYMLHVYHVFENSLYFEITYCVF